MEFEHVLQPNGSSCFGAVAAMAVGQGLEDVIAKIGHDGRNAFTWKEIMLYLLLYDKFLGTGIEPFELVDETLDELQVSASFRRPAMIGVKSEFMDGESHALYWDGGRVYDPSPQTKRSKLTDYEIISIWVISDLTADEAPEDILFKEAKKKIIKESEAKK